MQTWKNKKKHRYVAKEDHPWYDIYDVLTNEITVSCKDYGSAKAWFMKLNGYARKRCA